MCKLNTIHPYGLNFVFNGNNFNNVDNVCVYSKFNLTKNNYNYKRGCRGKKRNNKTEILSTSDSIAELSLKLLKNIKTLTFRLKNKVIVWFLNDKL